MEYCNRCMITELERDKTLSVPETIRLKNRSDPRLPWQKDLPHLRERLSQYNQSRLKEERKNQAQYEQMNAVEMSLKRLEEQRKKQAKEKQAKFNEELWSQITFRILQGKEEDFIAERMTKYNVREDLKQKIRNLGYQSERLSSQDLKEALEEYVELGDMVLERGKIKTTSQGARKLAKNILRGILKKTAVKGIDFGSHSLEEVGCGIELSASSRKYKMGDEYYKINFEKTILNALERNFSESNRKGTIFLESEDFQIYEEINQTKISFGLIIDESDSMSGDKVNAALDTALALSELIRRGLNDSLKVYLFSSQVKEIPYYDIPNVVFSGDTTDITTGMRAFRRSVLNERGDKQAYLITDTEPNTIDGKYLGFEAAAYEIVQEALRYRQAGITLNIIMLGETSRSVELASILAMKNLGRVYFTSPLKLGEVVIGDYLNKKRKLIR